MSRALDRLLRRGRQLIDLEVSEISIVDKAAALDEHGRSHTFAIIKRDAELRKLLEPFADSDLEALLKANDPKALAALREALKLLGGYVSGFPDDLQAAIKVLAQFVAPAADREGYGKKGKGKKPDVVEPDALPAEFDSDGDRAMFAKSRRRPMPEGGLFGAVCEQIVGAVNPAIVARWQTARLTKMLKAQGIDPDDLEDSDLEDLELADDVIEEGDAPPHRAKSKVLKGQGDDDGSDDGEPADNWPSLHVRMP